VKPKPKGCTVQHRYEPFCNVHLNIAEVRLAHAYVAAEWPLAMAEQAAVHKTIEVAPGAAAGL
jgi:hypothetical protein